jgi:vacuolar-type H+-ATPase subunit E/Vma4
MPKERADSKLDKEIISDARSQAERRLKAARKEAEEVVAAAKKEAKEQGEKILAAARKRAEAKASVVESSIEIEAQRISLAAREKAIQSILDESTAKLAGKSGYDYAASLVALGTEAIAKMSGDSFVVTLGKEDAASLGGQVLGRIAERVKAETGRDVRLRLGEPKAVSGGIIVESENGRERVDNSFARRLERYFPQIRLEVAAIVFPQPGGPQKK